MTDDTDTASGRSEAAPAMRFRLRRSHLAWPFLSLLAPGDHFATITPEWLEVRVGLLGRARIPVGVVARITTMHWPWWGGVGVRIGRGLVAFVPASGVCAVVETTEPVSVRAPLAWRTSRIVIAVEDVEGFAAALAEARRNASR